jgi:hypothetical protein
MEGCRVALYAPLPVDDYIPLVVAREEGGYTPTGCLFEYATKHDDALTICERLNKDVFGLEASKCHEIVALSMVRNRRKEVA